MTDTTTTADALTAALTAALGAPPPVIPVAAIGDVKAVETGVVSAFQAFVSKHNAPLIYAFTGMAGAAFFSDFVMPMLRWLSPSLAKVVSLLPSVCS